MKMGPQPFQVWKRCRIALADLWALLALIRFCCFGPKPMPTICRTAHTLLPSIHCDHLSLNISNLSPSSSCKIYASYIFIYKLVKYIHITWFDLSQMRRDDIYIYIYIYESVRFLYGLFLLLVCTRPSLQFQLSIKYNGNQDHFPLIK